jgi:hypothetical protein
VICSVTAGNDIGLLVQGRLVQGNDSDTSKGWRIWTTENENRRATVPYDMERNEDTIVAGMQLDFTATKKIDKPLYPDEEPSQCDALPILWVLNRSGQLAGWTVMYILGIKDGERPVGMMPTEWQDQYWLKEKERQKAGLVQYGGSRNKALSEEERPKTPSNQFKTTTDSASRSAQSPSKPTTPVAPTSLLNQSPARPAQRTFGQPSQLGATTSGFGQVGQLGGAIPGQSSVYSGFGANVNRPAPVFGQSSSLGVTSTPTPGSMGGGFAKYSASQPAQAGSFLSGGQTGSFLQGAKGGSFLQGGQSASSFLQGAPQSSSFLEGGQGNAFQKAGQDQGFAKFATPSRGFGSTQSMTTPSSFSDGGFLAAKPSVTQSSPFGGVPPASFTQRSESAASRVTMEQVSESRSQSYDMLEDQPSSGSDEAEEDDSESTKSEETDMEESESDEDHSVRIDALNFGDAGFDMNLNSDTTSRDTATTGERPSSRAEEVPINEGTTAREDDTSAKSMLSPQSSTGSEYVKVAMPSPLASEGKKPQETAVDNQRTSPAVEAKSQQPRPPVLEKAITPDPFPAPPQPSKPEESINPVTPQKIPQQSANANETLARSASPATRNRVELRQFVPVSGTPRIASKLSDSAVFPLRM